MGIASTPYRVVISGLASTSIVVMGLASLGAAGACRWLVEPARSHERTRPVVQAAPAAPAVGALAPAACDRRLVDRGSRTCPRSSGSRSHHDEVEATGFAPPGGGATACPPPRRGPASSTRFDVDLDACTGCKACVAACHSLNGLDEGEALAPRRCARTGSARRGRPGRCRP